MDELVDILHNPGGGRVSKNYNIKLAIYFDNDLQENRDLCF